MRRLLGALALATVLLMAGPGLASADSGDDPCGNDPDCISTVYDNPTDFGPDAPGIPGWFAGLFVLVVVWVGGVAYRVSTARSLARSAGMKEKDATAVALLDESGLSAAYVAASLRPRETEPAAGPPAGEPRPPAERLAELQALKDSGAITESEYAARRQAIIDSI